MFAAYNFGGADYKLADLLGIAGATIGIMIAAGILLQMISTRYVAIYERYRGLAGEFRANGASDLRKDSLKRELISYRLQVIFLNYGSMTVTVALLLFVVTVVDASLSVIYPDLMALRLIGTITLFSGLLLIGSAVLLVLLESVVQRPTIDKEVSDFADLPSIQEASKPSLAPQPAQAMTR